MACSTSTRAISAIVDGLASPGEMREIKAHLRRCEECADAVENTRRIREGSLGLPVQKPSVHLTTSLRCLASRERSRTLSRLNFAAKYRAWRGQLELTLTNLMQPLALPVAGGLISAIMLFSVLLPDFSKEVHPVPNDVPTVLFTDASVKYMPLIGEAEIDVDVTIDEQGRMADYRVVSGGRILRDETVRRRFESALLLTQFTPATTFGQPTAGRVRVSFRSSRIEIKG